ncbi:unnamed protein product [Amoebophrya sp. A120]|nr:unnamed protein product [Amoebophrya sp. A120]|eukprot:GSA120T00006503001.1
MLKSANRKAFFQRTTVAKTGGPSLENPNLDSAAAVVSTHHANVEENKSRSKTANHPEVEVLGVGGEQHQDAPSGKKSDNIINKSSASKTPSSPAVPNQSFASKSVHSRAEEELNINSLQMLLDRGQYTVDKKKQVGGCMNRFGRPVCCDEIEPEVEETASCLNADFRQEARVAIVTGVFGPGDKDEFTVGAIKMGKSLNVVLDQEDKSKPKRADLVILEINQFPIAEPYRVRLQQAGWKICTVTCVKNRSFIHQPALRHRFTFTKLKLLSFVTYEKAMWMDSDVQIIGNIDELIDFDFHQENRDCRMAAVRDLMIDSQNAKQPGIENRHNFNAGLMIVEPSWQQYFSMMKLLGPQHGSSHPQLRKMWWDVERRQKMYSHYVKTQMSSAPPLHTNVSVGIDYTVSARQTIIATSASFSSAALAEVEKLQQTDSIDTSKTSAALGQEKSSTTTGGFVVTEINATNSTNDANKGSSAATSLSLEDYERFVLVTDPSRELVADTGTAVFLPQDPPNTLTARPVQGSLYNPVTNRRDPVFHNAAIFITHPSMSENGALEMEEAVKYLPDPTFSEQGFWNDNYRHSWCRLPCKYNAILPYVLVPRLRFIWERCSRDARIVHWALFKPHFCPKLEPRFVSLDGEKDHDARRIVSTAGGARSHAGAPEQEVVLGTTDDKTFRPDGQQPGAAAIATGRVVQNEQDAEDMLLRQAAAQQDEGQQAEQSASSLRKNPAGFFSHEGDQNVNHLLGQNSHFISPTVENERFYFQEQQEESGTSAGDTSAVPLSVHAATNYTMKNGATAAIVTTRRSPYFPSKQVEILPKRFPRCGFYDYDPEFSLRGYLWNLGNSGIEARLVLRLFCFYYHIV